MSSIMLLPDELRDITGYSIPKFQCKWLDKQRWPYVRNRAGHPVVARDLAMQRLGVVVAGGHELVGIQPNFDAIKKTR